LDLGRFFSFSIFYTVDMIPWLGISPSQGRYLPTERHKHRINAHRHPCLKWDSSPRSQCLSGRRQLCLRSRGHCDRRLRKTFVVLLLLKLKQHL
jgi:hypothetical protein